MVVFDTSFLLLAFDEACKPPQDPQTGRALAQFEARMTLLIETLASTRILIPTPALAEYLVKAGKDRDARLTNFTNSKVFRVVSFGLRAAEECALLAESDGNGHKKLGFPEETRVKVKFDRQIIAIAKVENAHTIYTDDTNLAKKAKTTGLQAVLPSELPLPPQGELFKTL
jgi:hypothetical protein